MEAPAQSSPAPDPDARGSRRAGSRGMPPWLRFALALGLFLLLTYWALSRGHHADAYRQTSLTSVFSGDWWTYPYEWNPAGRLPFVGRDLEDVYAVPNTQAVYAVGELGGFFRSEDGGKTWDDITPQLISARATPTPAFTNVNASNLNSIISNFNSNVSNLNGPSARSRNANSNAIASQTYTLDNPPPTPMPTPTPTPNNYIQSRTLSTVRFEGEREGSVLTEDGECFHTTAGGLGWRPCEATLVSTRELLNVGGATYVLGLGRVYLLPYPTANVKANVDKSLMPGLLMSLAAAMQSEPLRENLTTEVFFVNPSRGWANDDAGEGVLLRTNDGGATWEPLRASLPPDTHLRKLFFVDESRGWAVSTSGEIYFTRDGGDSWAQQNVPRQSDGSLFQLRAVSFQPDGLRGSAVGNAGAILYTEDGGTTWLRQTRDAQAGELYYFRLLPPLYYVSLVAVAFLLVPLRRTASVDTEQEEPEPSVADVLVSDRPLEEGDADTIDFRPIALGLSRFLRNENTKPPLTIAITGEWGTGKSSLMNLLRADLRRYDFRPIWFNAWHHQKEEHLLASLLQHVRLQAVPDFWKPAGIVFRLRLLGIRGARHWLPVLLLLFVAAVVLFYELIRNSSGAVNTYPEQLFRGLASLVYGDQKPDLSEFTKTYLSRLPLLVSLLTIAGTLWRGAKAFGVNPASLMASMSSGVRVRDLDAQTSFRQLFASEFNDVTEALGPRSMIIFIDDLDRCRPENVVETLEAVNFLVSSGGCFVVIGMARERVEPCVGLSFKDVAAEMLDDGEDDEAAAPMPAEADAKQVQEERARRKRLEYARQYLDKLVNIEVPVPVPTPEQSCGIFVANARGADEQAAGAKRAWWRRFVPAYAEAYARDYGRVLLWGASAVLLLSFCYALASFLARPLPADKNASATAASPTPTQTPAPTPASAAARGTSPSGARPAPTSTPTSTPTPTPTPSNAALPVLTYGKSSFLPATLPVLAVFLVVAWVGYWVLTRRPGLVVKDSPKFMEALEVWHPVVYARSKTPRSAKRFMNRVRYLAMRQRPQADCPPAWRRLLRRLGTIAKGAAAEPAAGDESALGALDWEKLNSISPIPDELLVALAALQHFDPDWLEDDALLFAPPGHTPEQITSWPKSKIRDFVEIQRVKEAHEHKFGWGDEKALREARRTFFRVSKGVHVN